MSNYATISLSFLPRLLLYAVWLVAILIAVKNWQRHPRASLFTVIGLGIMFLTALLSAGSNYFLLPMFQQSDSAAISVSGLIFIVSAVSTLLHAAAWGFIIAAIFSGRRAGESG